MGDRMVEILAMDGSRREGVERRAGKDSWWFTPSLSVTSEQREREGMCVWEGDRMRHRYTDV